MKNVITELVSKDLCSSCGVCAGFCPSNALSMELQENGNLEPQMKAGCCLEKCHICLDLCPFSAGIHNPRKSNVDLFSSVSGSKYNEDVGWYTLAAVGFRSNEGLRAISSSGGLATWCLEILLEKKMVTRVAVVRVVQNHHKGFFEFYSASSVDELRKAAGSIYHPVEISAIIKEIQANEQDRWAIVGVPCLCAAMRNNLRLRKKVPYVLGLACGMYQNTFYTELLLSKSGVNCEHIEKIEYRRKFDGEEPSNYRFRGTDNQGPGKEIPYHGLPFFLGKHAFFRLNACNFCMDVFAEAADACFMDAWSPAYRREAKGTSLVVIRNSELSKLFLQGQDTKELSFDEINAEELVLSQSGHVRRKRELIYMRQGVQAPVKVNRAKPTMLEKVNWKLEKITQTRSKRAWAKYGRKYGKIFFWLSLADLLIVQRMIKFAIKIIVLPRRVMAKFNKMLALKSV
jgi:coenzyme F420-reducing hydrogenase beta subunit